VDVALSLRERVEAEFGAIPFTVLVNKHDLLDHWAIADTELESLRRKGYSIRTTSARSGEGVEDAFTEIAARTSR
jgi:putative ribosome biogenesis GTPase RsgA